MRRNLSSGQMHAAGRLNFVSGGTSACRLQSTEEGISEVLVWARQIKAARSLIGWEQYQLAVEAGVGIATVRRLEKMSGPYQRAIRDDREDQKSARERRDRIYWRAFTGRLRQADGPRHFAVITRKSSESNSVSNHLRYPGYHS